MQLPSQIAKNQFLAKEEKEGADMKFSPKVETKRSEFLRRWSSYKERKGNALASGADEGRDKLR